MTRDTVYLNPDLMSVDPALCTFRGIPQHIICTVFHVLQVLQVVCCISSKTHLFKAEGNVILFCHFCNFVCMDMNKNLKPLFATIEQLWIKDKNLV